MHLPIHSAVVALSTALWCRVMLCSSPQIPLKLDLGQNRFLTAKPKRLHGRFLHITDMHPDPHYTPHSNKNKACHGKKANKRSKEAGYWGVPYGDCDSSLRLTNFTLDFLEKNWADEIDFVIWTGDNARHDEDNKIPRTPSEIYTLNRAIASKMKNIFSKRGIPVVPSLGNNDIWPHNIMTPGPNSITNEFSAIWSEFIPFPQRQVFQRGAYYSIEVIPDQVAVIALNAIYFFDSNKAVGGCQYGEHDDPGNLQFDWLEVQLEMYRKRNMQVYLSGHVPPSPGLYFPECYTRYVELSLRFQDTILGHLYGHMNVDFFSFVLESDLQIFPETDDEKLHIAASHDGLYETLLNEYAQLPKRSKEKELDKLAVVNVAPSVVPNPFVPGFRIYSYNVTDEAPVKQGGRDHKHHRGQKLNKSKHCNEEPYKRSWKCHLNKPWHSDPEAPSRRNRRWTPLGYAQYYMPDLGAGNKTHHPHYEMEYMTYDIRRLHPEESGDKKFQYPVPVGQLPRSLRSGERTKESKYAPYSMEDLTIGSWVGLGRRLSGEGHGKLRRRFRKYLFVSKQE